MDRIALEQYIADTYSAVGEHLWLKSPNYAVFRHYSTRKWFAIIMDIPRFKLGLDSAAIVDVVNVHCDPLLIDPLLHERGFFPAYHMNKGSWVTISLDGEAEDEKIKWLLDMSFELAGKGKKITPRNAE